MDEEIVTEVVAGCSRHFIQNVFTWTSWSIIILLICYYLFNGLRFAKNANKLPQLKTFPVYTYWKILRNLYRKNEGISALVYVFQMICGMAVIFRKDKVANFWISFRPAALFYHPETIEVVLNNSVSLNKSREYKFLDAWLGTGLLTSSGEKWKSRRKLLTPAFHFRILEDFIPVFDEQSKILVKKLRELTKQEWINLQPLVTLCTLDIICETAMGVQINAQSNADSDYFQAIKKVGNAYMYRIAQPWLWVDWMYFLFPSGRRFLRNLDILHGFTRKVIKEKKDALSSKGHESASILNDQETNDFDVGKTRQRRAFLELLVEHHQKDPSFTEEDIREEVDTFMFEGHDTTAAGLTWAFYNIGLLPDVQEKIHQELDEIFGEDRSRPVTADDIKSMRYLECVIKESLRLYPSVPFIARELEGDLEILGYTISPGSLCLIFPYMLHRDPTIYENPEKFEPERFLPENCIGRHPYAYLPFSAGVRNCIGQKFALMEEKTVIANVLRNFKVISLDHRDRILIPSDIILRSTDPLRMKLELR